MNRWDTTTQREKSSFLIAKLKCVLLYCCCVYFKHIFAIYSSFNKALFYAQFMNTFRSSSLVLWIKFFTGKNIILMMDEKQTRDVHVARHFNSIHSRDQFIMLFCNIYPSLVDAKMKNSVNRSHGLKQTLKPFSPFMSTSSLTMVDFRWRTMTTTHGHLTLRMLKWKIEDNTCVKWIQVSFH